MTMNSQKNDESEGLDDSPIRTPAVAFLLHAFMIALSLAIIFVISGSLLVLASTKNDPFMSTDAAETIFIIGGLAGDAAVVWIYFRKKRHVI